MCDTGLVTGYWPALDHISEPSAGRCESDAVQDRFRAVCPHLTINRSRAREGTLQTQTGFGAGALVCVRQEQDGREKQIYICATCGMSGFACLSVRLLSEREINSYRSAMPTE